MICKVLTIGVFLLLPLATTQETTFTQNGLKSGSDVVSPKLDDKPVFKRSNCVQQHDPYSIAVKNICLQQNKCSARYPLHLCKRIIDKPKHVIRYINYPAGSSQFLCTCKQPKAKPYREEYLRAGLDGISEHDKFDLKNKFPLVINSKHDYTSQGNTNIKESPSGKWGKGTFYIDRNGFPWIRQQIPETEYNDYRFQGYIPQNKFQVVSETYKTDKEEIRNDSPILKDNIDFSKLKLEPLDSPTVPQDVPYGTYITLLPSIDDTESGDTLNYGDESSPIINHSDPEKANNLRNESPPGNQFDTKGLINIYGNSYEIPSKHSETEDKTIIFGYGNTNVPPKYTENNPLINDPGKILPYDPPLAENMQVYGYGVDTPLTSNPDIEEYLEIFGYGQSNRTPKYPGKSSSESDKIISQHKGHDISNNKKDGGRTDKSPFASHHNIGESTDSLKLLGYDNTNKMPPYTINKDTSIYDPYGYKTEPNTNVKDTLNIDGYSTQYDSPTTTTQLQPGSVYPLIYGSQEVYDSRIETPQSHGSSQNLPGTRQLVAETYPDPYGYVTQSDSYVTDMPNVDGYSLRPGLPATTKQQPGSVYTSKHVARVVDSGVGTPQSQESTQKLPDITQLIACKYSNSYGYETEPDSHVTDTQNNDGYSPRPGLPATTTQLQPGSNYPSICETQLIGESGVGTPQSHGDTQKLPDAPQLVAGKYPDANGYDTDPDSYITDTPNVDGYSTRSGLPTTTTQLQTGSDSGVGTPQSQEGTHKLPSKTQLITGKLHDLYGYKTEPDSYVTDTQNNDGYSTQPGLPTSGIGMPQRHGISQNVPGAPQLVAVKYPDAYGYESNPDPYVTDTPNVDGYSTRPGLPTTTTQLHPVSDSGVETPHSHGNTQNLPDAPQLVAGKYPDAYGYESDPDSYVTDTRDNYGYSTQPGFPTTTIHQQLRKIYTSIHGARVIDDSGMGMHQSHGNKQNLPDVPQLIAWKYPDTYSYESDPDPYVTDTQNNAGYSTQPGLPTSTTQQQPSNVFPSKQVAPVVDSRVGTPKSQDGTQILPGKTHSIAGKLRDPYGYETEPDSYVTDTQNNGGYSTQPGLPTSTTQRQPESIYPSKQAARVVDSGVGTPQSQERTQKLPGITQLLARKYPDSYDYKTDPDSYVTDTPNVDDYSTRPELPITTTQLQPGSNYPSICETQLIGDSGVGTPQSHGNTQKLPDAPQLVAGKYPDAYGYENDHDSYITDTPNVDGYSTRPGLPTTTTQLQTGSDSGVGTPQSQEGTHKLPSKTQLITGKLHDLYGYNTEPDRYSTQPGLPTSGVGMPQSHGNTKNVLDVPQLVAGKYPDAYGYESDPDSYVTDTQNNAGYSTQPGLPTSTTQQQPGSIYPSKQVAPVVDSGVGTPQSQDGTQILPGKTQLIAGKYPDTYGYESDSDPYVTDTQNNGGYSTQPGLPTTNKQQQPMSIYPSKHVAPKVDSGVGTPQSHGNTQNLPDAPQLVAGKYPDAYGYETDPDSYITDTPNVDGYSTRPGLSTTTTQLQTGSDSGVGTSQSQEGTQKLPSKTQLIAGKLHDLYGYNTEPDRYSTQPGLPTSGVGMPQSHGNTKNVLDVPQLVAGKYPDAYGYESDPDPYVTDTQNNDGYSTQPGLPTSTTQQQPGSIYTSKQVAPVVDSGVGTPQSQDGTEILPGKTQLIAGKYPDTYGYESDRDPYVTDTQNNAGYSTQPGLPTTNKQQKPGSVYSSKHVSPLFDAGVGTPQSQESTQKVPGITQLIAGKYPCTYGYETDPDSYVTNTPNVKGYSTRPTLPSTTTQLPPGSLYPSIHDARVVDSVVGLSESQLSTQNHPGEPVKFYQSGYQTNPYLYVTPTSSVEGYPRRPALPAEATQSIKEVVHTQTYGKPLVGDSRIGVTVPRGSTQSQSATPDSISIKSLYPSENESDPESYVTSSLSVDGHSREPELSSTTTQHPESVYPSSYVTRVVDDSGIDTTEPQEENENPHTFLDWNHPETLSDRTENNENPEYFHRHNKPSLPESKKIFNYFKEKSPTRTAHFVNMPPSYYRNSDTSLQESHQGFANTDQHNLRESSNSGDRSPDSSSTASDNEERNEEYSDDKVVSFYDGCVMTTSQFKDIVDSMKIPEECVLTVPHLFSGPLDKFSHVMKSFPSSVNSDEGFVQLPSGLLVPYHCYDYITFMHQSGSGSEPSGTLLSTGEYIDPTTVANIVASATTPHQNFIITTNNEVVPYEIYSTYIDSLSRDDKKLIKVLVPNLKVPIPYLIFKEIYDKYTSESGCNESSEDKVKLIGSDTEITLKEFLSVISNLYVLNQATVTLPSKSTMSLTSFIQLSRILGEEYTKHCLVNIPNTDYSIPFLVFKEIYSTYFKKNSPNLSKDTNVNLKLSVSDEYPHSSDVEVFNLDRDITIENQSSPSKSCRNTRHNTEQRTPNEKEVQFVPDKQHTYSEFRKNCYSCPS